MDNQQNSPVLREMYRKSMDSIRVYNPTNKDFVVEWDGFKHIVPASTKDVGFGKGQRVLARYLAEKYVRDMRTQIINQENEKAVQAMIDDAPYELKSKYETDPYERQRLWDRQPRTDDPKKTKEIFKTLWMGVEERYGLDQIGDEESPLKIDTRTMEERILAEMDKPIGKIEVKSEPKPKAKLAEEVQK